MRRGTIKPVAIGLLILMLTGSAGAEGDLTLTHTPPVQVYRGAGFQLTVETSAQIKRLFVRLEIDGESETLPMRYRSKQFTVTVPGRATKDRRGPVTYSFLTPGGNGEPTELPDGGGPYHVKIVDQPAAAVVQPRGRAVHDAFTVSIALNDAFAVLTADSFKVTFAGQDVSKEITYADGVISFVAGPGMRNGFYVVRLETTALPGWKRYRKSWWVSLRKAPPDPVRPQGPLTIGIQGAEDPTLFADTNFDRRYRAYLEWDSSWLGLTGGDINIPTLSSLTLEDKGIFGVSARLDLNSFAIEGAGGLSQEATLETYPCFVGGLAVGLGNIGVNLAAVAEVPSTLTDPAMTRRQSYVISLDGAFGSDVPGEAGIQVELAYALSFPDAQGTMDWSLLQLYASTPGAPDSVKILAFLQPVLKFFPLPQVEEGMPIDSLPQVGMGYRLGMDRQVGAAMVRLEFSRIEPQFLSLGSLILPGNTAVLMVAFDPDRSDTKPYLYDPGPVMDSPDYAAETYGLHLSGVGFKLLKDPVRAGFDYFTTSWHNGGEWREADLYRLNFGYYGYLDLHLSLEGGTKVSPLGQDFSYYGVELLLTRMFGYVTLNIGAGIHRDEALATDLAYGLSLGLDYTFGNGDIILGVLLERGNPFHYALPTTSQDFTGIVSLSINF